MNGLKSMQQGDFGAVEVPNGAVDVLISGTTTNSVLKSGTFGKHLIKAPEQRITTPAVARRELGLLLLSPWAESWEIERVLSTEVGK